VASISSLSTAAWAIQLSSNHGALLGALRLVNGIEVGLDSNSLWLRSRARDESLDALLRALPAMHRFDWEKEDVLRPVGSRLASARFPEVNWQPLRAWLQVTFPVAQLPAVKPFPVAMRLVPSGAMQPANAALVPLANWVAWAESAPELRLRPLRFATAMDGCCLVLGAPLPSIPGRLFVERDGVVIPAGVAWSPAVSALTLRRLFGAPDQNIVLWDEAGIRHLSPELIVPASRANARATASGFHDSSA